MPKLYIFAICEKVILDKQDRASLISLFNQVSAQILPNQKEIPSNAVIPFRWCIYTSWERESEDIGKEYLQKVELLYPSGERFGPVVSATFTPESTKRYNQVVMEASAFPVGQRGQHTLKMWLEHAGSTIFESPPLTIMVEHHKLDAIPENLTVFGSSF